MVLAVKGHQSIVIKMGLQFISPFSVCVYLSVSVSVSYSSNKDRTPLPGRKQLKWCSPLCSKVICEINGRTVSVCGQLWTIYKLSFTVVTTKKWRECKTQLSLSLSLSLSPHIPGDFDYRVSNGTCWCPAHSTSPPYTVISTALTVD